MSAVSVLLAPNDEAFGERISDALLRQGHTARIFSGDQADLFVDGKGDEDASIVVWSEAALKLAALHVQAREALEKGALIPVALDGAAPPSEFESLPPIDLSEWRGDEADPRWRFVLETLSVATAIRRSASEPERHGGTEDASQEIIEYTPRRRPRKPARRGIDPSAVGAVGIATLCLATGAAIILAPSFMGGAKRQALSDAAPTRPVDLAVIQPAAPPSESANAFVPDTISGAGLAAPPADFGDEDIALADDELEGFGEGDISYPDSAPPDVSFDNAINADSRADAIHLAMLGPVAPVDEPPVDDAAGQPETQALLGPAAPSVKPAPSTQTTEVEARAAPGDIEALIASVAEPGDAQAAASSVSRGNSAAGDMFRDCVSCPDMAVIASGAFTMGPIGADAARTGEGPAQKVTIAAGYAISTQEVTFAQWDACVADGGCAGHKPFDFGWGRGEQPVVGVSYKDAERYAAWLTEKTGHAYRLPSEAEWEFAARAGTATAFSFGDDLSADAANYDGRFVYKGKKGRWIGHPQPAGAHPANAFGLYDMHGNVWEWTADCWAASLAGVPADGAPRAGACSRRVLKGGAFNTGGWRLRAAHRIGKPASVREMEIGFRLVRALD